MDTGPLPEFIIIVGGRRQSFHSSTKAAEFAAKRIAVGEQVSYDTNAATEVVRRQRISAIEAKVKDLLVKQGISYS